MRNYYAFLACLLLSAGTWLIHNLSRMQTDVVTVSVSAESNLVGRASRSRDEVGVTARCKASGFRLLNLNWTKKVRTVHFDADDLKHKDGDYFTVSANQLYRYVGEIFAPGVTVESFLVDGLSFRFLPERYKKVPVKAVSQLGFKPQYMAVSELSISPDSVLVYGSPEMLKSIECVYTRTIIRNDLKGNIHGEAALEKPEGVRLSASTVAYTLDVSRFVELQMELPVELRNVPAGVDFAAYPAVVSATLRCVFPLVADPSGAVSCYVDYNEFAGSITGKCLVHTSSLPSGVIKFQTEPDVCECVEKIGLQ